MSVAPVSNRGIVERQERPLSNGSTHIRPSATSYVLGHEPSELERLATQSRAYADVTDQALGLAGIVPGMRVLDVGCGLGDVSLLLANRVGERGEVIAVDCSPEVIAKAQTRADALHVSNIHFLVGAVESVALDAPVDAVVGRLILMHCGDPVVSLRNLSAQVAPGGLMCFMEFDLASIAVDPPVPLANTWIDRVRETFRRAGVSERPGIRLHHWFVEAGLPAPQMQQFGRVEAAPALDAIRMLTGVVRTLQPVMIQTGVASADEIDIDSLEQRLSAEVAEIEPIIVTPPLIAAWTRLP
jgi:ubiquinone/menaquinone biosynthesis C-methylase UbiE